MDSLQMLKDYHEITKVRTNKKWESDAPEVNYDFDESGLSKGNKESYKDMLKDLRG